MQKPLITPIPNLNGNSAESLLLQLNGVLTALKGLDKAMRHACDIVHGRNFQTLGPIAEWSQRQAQDAWLERQRWLVEFELEVENMAIAISAQREAR